MNDKNILKKINLECALKGEPLKNLKDILNLYEEEWLNGFYYVITKKETDENKVNMINKIFDELTNEDVIQRFLNTLVEDEYKEIVRIIENNGILQDDYIKHKNYCYLMNFGLAYSFNYQNKLYVIIPEEIMNILIRLNVTKYHEKIIENSKIVNLAYSMLHLYGIVPFNIFINACCKYYNYSRYEEINLDCIFIPERQNSIKLLESDNNDYLIKEEHLEDYDKGFVAKLIDKLEDDLFECDFKEIDLEDLLKYNNLYYYEETDAVIEFKEYLRDKNMSEERIDLLVGAIVGTFRKDYSEGVLYLNEIFEEENFNIDENNIDEILAYVNNIINDIAMWENKGWTNKEIILGKCYE